MVVCKSGWGHTNFPLLSCHLLLKYSNSVFLKESQIIKAFSDVLIYLTVLLLFERRRRSAIATSVIKHTESTGIKMSMQCDQNNQVYPYSILQQTNTTIKETTENVTNMINKGIGPLQ